jgi:hypothetical protein
MADSELEKTTPPLGPFPEPLTSGPHLDNGDLGTTSRTLSIHTLESVASSPSPSTTIADNENVEHAGSALDRVVTPRRNAVKVPRSRRRGLLGRFALVAEVQNPYDYDNNLKWFITFIVALAGAAAPMGSSIFFRKSILAHTGGGTKGYSLIPLTQLHLDRSPATSMPLQPPPTYQ